ncbi:MAG TPA: glycolate oxidase subunit GlcF [Steroidobacteraceae bacterium]|nr:glycolate oxidase subunit GlcF [Steroidobacteraceae bacterium]
MQTRLSQEFKNTPEGDESEAILRKCVHCGFCNATCPTYQLLGDELDGPRGRIYLIKQALEGADVSRSTQLHLDRCLTCRNCETTCPSGVEFGALIDIGRRIVEQRVERPAGQRALRWLLKEFLTSRAFSPAMRIARRIRPLLPDALRRKVPEAAGGHAARTRRAPDWPTQEHARKVLLLAGCVQPAMMPNINAATARVLDAAGIQPVLAADGGCCGALRLHLADHDGALADMRRNIDAWWPLVAAGSIEAIVSNASGCSVTVKDYAHALRADPVYAEKAARISAIARDLSELLPDLARSLEGRVRAGAPSPLAFHSPCSLQHGQRLRGLVETHLGALGFEIKTAAAESHLCCGSAGTYSVLQPALADELRDRKLEQLAALGAPCIVSANIGCIQHLQTGTATRVAHWIEVLDEAIV